MGNGEKQSANGEPPSDAEAISRLAELMLWIFHKGRRPGLLGKAVRVSGVLEDRSPAALERAGDQWTFVKAGATPVLLPDEKAALEVIPNEGFYPREVVVVPDVAPLLFHGAVEAAEASVHECNVALAVAVRIAPEGHKFIPPDRVAQVMAIQLPDPVTYVLGNAALDKAVRHSIASIALSVATVDAQLNAWANDKGGFSKSEQAKPLISKFDLVAQKFNETIDIAVEPYRSLHQRIRARNEIIHAKGKEQSLSLEPQKAGRDISLQARGTCLAVRSALIDLANRLTTHRPNYLAYCPPDSPEDDEAWSGAIIRTGLRDDPDFPTASVDSG